MVSTTARGTRTARNLETIATACVGRNSGLDARNVT